MTSPAFRYYGGRGITVCDRWKDNFENFLVDMPPHPGKGYSIDRIDNDGNYEPGNCRWATREEQARNKRNNHIIRVGDRALTLAEWAATSGVKRATIAHRLKSGWSAERAVTTPTRRPSKKQVDSRPLP